MNEPRADVTELTAFMAVATHRSFRKAAEELRVAPSTLSHAVRRLEARVRARLLHRTTRSVATTAAGAALLDRLRPLLRELNGALAEVADAHSSPRGTVRISANLSGARILLRDVLPDFRARWPDIHVDVAVEGRLVDIVAEGFDAGIRL